MTADDSAETPFAGTIPGIDVVQPLYFNIWDESKSVFFQANVKAFNPDVDQVRTCSQCVDCRACQMFHCRCGADPLWRVQTDEGFGEGNLKHSINGYVFCNMPDVSLHI
jgi:hypothetical protein